MAPNDDQDRERRTNVETRVGRFEGLDAGEDVEDWLDRVEFCVKAFPDAVGDEAVFIASMLGLEPWRAYAHLGATIKNSAAELKKWLKNTYGIRPEVAFRRLRRRAMGPEETLAAYVTDFRRLVARSQVSDLGVHASAMLFIDGLPDYLRQGLAAKGGAKSIDSAMAILRDLEIARDVGRVGPVGSKGGSVAVKGPENRQTGKSTLAITDTGNSGAMGGSRPKVDCYVCRGPHYRKDCPHKGDVAYLRCFRCSQKGHFVKDCPDDPARMRPYPPQRSQHPPPQFGMRGGSHIGSTRTDGGSQGQGPGVSSGAASWQYGSWADQAASQEWDEAILDYEMSLTSDGSVTWTRSEVGQGGNY